MNQLMPAVRRSVNHAQMKRQRPPRNSLSLCPQIHYIVNQSPKDVTGINKYYCLVFHWQK